jgi:hypothetical protein
MIYIWIFIFVLFVLSCWYTRDWGNNEQIYKEYRKKQTQLLKPYINGEDMVGVSISDADKENGSPKNGDMIAINRNDETDKWLVAEKFFKDNYELAN